MQIEPQTTIPLLYKITDPYLFSTTFYVRAVIRDTLSGTTIQSVNLTRGSDGKRYTGTAQAPADGSGLGKHIDVTVSSYSDSGYSSYADSLPEIVDKYLVKAQSVVFGGGGRDSDTIDYKQIRKIVQEIVDNKKIPAPEKLSLSPVLSELQDVLKAIRNIHIPEVHIPTPDYSSVISAVKGVSQELQKKIAGIKFPDQEKVDLSPLYTFIKYAVAVVERAETTSHATQSSIRKFDEKNAKIKDMVIPAVQDIVSPLKKFVELTGREPVLPLKKSSVLSKYIPQKANFSNYIQ